MVQRNSGIKLGGGAINGLDETTILYGKGQNIVNLDFNNITINPLNFKYPLIFTSNVYFNNDLTSNEITIDSNYIYSKTDVDNIFQPKLIPNNGININNNSNISVDFTKSGFTNNQSNIYTTIPYFGVGTSNPLDSLHIKNDNAAIIIDNNINKFKFANTGNYLSIGSDNGHNEIIENDIYFKNQFKIHRDAPIESLIIDNFGMIKIISNINVNNETYLSDKIFINNSNIINWLSLNGLASYDYVKNNINTDPTAIIIGVGKNITELDYNNITNNKLTFTYPLISNITTNNISFDVAAIGWDKTTDVIYTNKFKLGIGTSDPLGLVHIGSSTFSSVNSYRNDGTLVLSKSTLTRNANFKFGFDDNFNFIFGNLNSTTWNSQFIINNNAPNNSLTITNSGNININNSLNINSNLILNGGIILNKFNIDYSNNNFILGNSLLILNNSGFIGIGTTPDNIYTLSVEGHIKTSSNIYANDIFINNGTFLNLNLNTINITSTIRSSNCILSSNLVSRNVSNLSLISTRNLFTSNLITSTNINTTNISSTGTYTANIINASNIISSNLNIIGDTYISSNLISSNSSFSNLNSINCIIDNINAININSINSINCDNNINAANIISGTINGTVSLTTPLLNSITINATSININDITTSNIISSNLIASILTIDNISITKDNIITPLTTSTSIVSTNVFTNSLTATESITSSKSIKCNSLSTTNINCDNRIAIDVTNPIADIHIGNSQKVTNNPSLIITNRNNNFKIGYDNRNTNFIFGKYEHNNALWTSQLSINNGAPTNSLTINALGNIGIGKNNDNVRDYKLDINGSLNATNLFQNNEKVLSTADINSIVNNSLTPYITSNIVVNTYSTINYVNDKIDENTTYIENTITKVLAQDSNVYTSQKRYPTNIINSLNISLPSLYFSSIYAIKETIAETIIINNEEVSYEYEIYSSSAPSIGVKNKSFLFEYTTRSSLYSVKWSESNYYNAETNTYTTFNENNIPQIMKDSPFYTVTSSIEGYLRKYVGDYIIFKFNQPIILSKFIFYILTENIKNGPGNWICIASNDPSSNNSWNIIRSASLDILTQLNRSAYKIYDNNLSYYEKNVEGDIPYLYYAFIFNKLVFGILNTFLDPGMTLELTRIEFYGRYKIQTIYVTSNLLDNTLDNYATINQLNQKLNKNITFTYPLSIDQYYQNITFDVDVLLNASQNNQELSNLIVDYINNQTSTWKSDLQNANNIYYSYSGCVGIGSTLINTTNISDLKLDIHGRIRTSNINVISTINAGNLIGNGDGITNINYNNIPNKPDLKNLNNWNININNNIYASSSSKIGIGHVFGNFLDATLSVNGSISANSTIIGNNFQENGILLTNKYLTINNADINYFKKNGGTITGAVGINSAPLDGFMLNVNGNINSTNTINAINIQENGINIASKYITIQDANNFYLSKFNGGSIDGNVIINDNIGIGTSITEGYKLNINGNSFFLGNIITTGSINQNNSSQSNIFIGNVGIGTTIHNNYNLFVSGDISLNRTLISGFINQNNSSQSNIFLGNIGIGTTIPNSYNLFVPGNTNLNTTLITGFINQNNSSQSNIFLGRIGIGTTNPDNYHLNVNGNSYFNGNSLITGFINQNNSSQSNIFLGKIGIGTNDSGNYNLNINGSLNAISIYNNDSLIDFNSYATKTLLNNTINNYATLLYVDNNYVNNTVFNNKFILYSQTGADPNYFKLTENNIVSGNTTFSGLINSLNISNSSNINSSNLFTSNLIVYNNIGINTTISSTFKFNINGSIYSSNNIQCAGNLNEGGVNLVDKYLTITNANNNYLSLNGGSISGNIGIGTVSIPSLRVNVNGSIYSSNNIQCAGNLNEGGINLINKYLTITNANQNYLSLNGGTIINNLTINNNVGIGFTATAAYKLYVNGNIYCANTISENGILLSNKYLSLIDGGTVLGNVGIGTLASSSIKLNVAGSIYSSNDIICAGNLNEGGVNLSDKYLKIANAAQFLITGDFLNNQPNLQKKIGFKFICNKPIILNNETYYKYDINISHHVKDKIDNTDMTNYRIFNIKCFSTIGIFTTMTANKPPNILQYDVYMSSLPSINICAIGFPSNYYLNKITAGDICLLKTTNYNYISVISKTNNNNISCIISDFLF